MTTDISNSDDYIDSRDVIKRIEELVGERTDLAEAVSQAMNLAAEIEADAGQDENAKRTHEEAFQKAERELAEWDEDYGDELKALQALQEQAEGSGDWEHGATLIRDSYFRTYAQEFAEDIHGDAMRNASWPFDYIDWDRAIDALQMDYTAVEFDGVTYWLR